MSATTKKILIASILVLVCVACIYGGLWYVIMLRKHAVYEHVTSQGSQEMRRRELSSLLKTLSATESERAELHRHILDDDKVTEFLELVEGAARTQGLSIETKSVGIVPLPEDASFEALALTFEVEGLFAHMNTFISLLETLPFQAQIGSVSLERISDSSAGLWRGTFILQVTKLKGS